MTEFLKDTEPKKVFSFFEQISKIPRGSGNEKGISDYLVKFAKERNLEVIQDNVLNVIIKKPATKGYEEAPTLILQSHMDMVCKKNADVEHDFTKDPIELEIDGDFIRAKGTTSGADNGIGVAISLTVLDSQDIQHPSLEVVFTVEEETTMKGAKSLDAALLKGKPLLGLDNDREGELMVSGAGFIDVKISMAVNTGQIPVDSIAYVVRIGGLKGGHPGNDIHLQRGNANCLMGRFLREISERIDLYICVMSGGLNEDAIPTENETIIYINESDSETLKELCQKWDGIYKEELKYADKDVYLKLEKASHSEDVVLDKEIANRLITFLTVAPNGVQTMSRNIEGLTESSLNIEVVNTNKSEMVIKITIRSCVDTLGYNILNKLKQICMLLGMNLQVENQAPALEYKENSRLRDLCIRVYEGMYNKKPLIKGTHAGIEGGIFSKKIDGADICLIAPNLYDIHSPSERLSISSTQRVWEYFKQVLKEFKRY